MGVPAMDSTPEGEDIAPFTGRKVMPEGGLVTGQLNVKAIPFLSPNIPNHKGMVTHFAGGKQMVESLFEPPLQPLF